MIFLFQSRTLQKIAASLLLAVFCTGFFSAAYVPQAYAQEEEQTYYDGPSFDELFEKYAEQCAEAALIQFVISAVLGFALTQVPVTDWASAVKDMIEDCLVSATKNALLELVTGQAVGWSQKGYGGNPSFVQNITQYLTGIADQAAGTYIQNIGGGFLCSPFRAQIQLALTQYYQGLSGRSGGYGGYGGSGLTSCTLSQMAGVDVDAFLGGDFYAGGWEAWIEMAANPYNTPYGAYLETVEELNKVVAEKADESKWKLDFANGFLSKEVQNCYTEDWVEEDGTVHEDYYSYCDPAQVITPGDTIKTSLEKSFGIKLDSIVAADEINEIISLVAVYLLTDILTKDEGLTGYDYETDFDDPLVDTGGIWGDDDGGGGGQCTPTNPTSGTPGSSITYTSATVNDYFGENLPLPAGKRWGDYRRIVISLDLTVGEWNGPGTQYNVLWLNRGSIDWAGGANRIIEVTAVQDSPDKVRAVTQLDSCVVDNSNQKSQNFGLQTGQTYTFEVDYEPAAGRAEVIVRQGGSQVVRINLSPTAEFISSTNSKGQTGYFLQLGAYGSAEGNEGNTDGWRWNNISVEFEP